LNKKTIGIIGTGNIGQHMIRIANGFGMNVIAYDINPNKKLTRKLGFRYEKFDSILKHSDIISLHIPYNKFTHHLINTNNIKKIKKGAIIINTSRGAIIDTNALIYGLNKKIISAAGLDVLEEENFIGDEIKLLKSNISKEELNIVFENNMLTKRKNVIITPHNAFNTKEAIERILETTVYNIKSFIKHKKVNLV
jgi:D-lactate dehydrogenase